MILSAQDRFENDTALTVTRVSTNSYDLGVARDLANNEGNLWLIGIVGTAFTAGGSAVLSCDLIGSAAANLGTPTILQPLATVVPVASLVAGYTIFKVQLQIGVMTQRYFGLNWTVATGPMTAGTLKAYLANNVDAQKIYPKGYSI